MDYLKLQKIRNLTIKDRFNFRRNKNKEIANLEKIFLNVRELHPNSEIYLTANLVHISILIFILLVYVTPYSLLISIPIILSFIGGIIMESISLVYEKDSIKKSNEEE